MYFLQLICNLLMYLFIFRNGTFFNTVLILVIYIQTHFFLFIILLLLFKKMVLFVCFNNNML